MGKRRMKSAGGDGDGGGGKDLISNLPDEILHSIIRRIAWSKSAEQTIALSNRWRNLWRSYPVVQLNPKAHSPFVEFYSITSEGFQKFHEATMKSSIDFKGQDFELIPFGAGRRGCPGISFATASIQITLACLLQRFDWSLPGGRKAEDLDADEAPGLAVHRKTPLSYDDDQPPRGQFQLRDELCRSVRDAIWGGECVIDAEEVFDEITERENMEEDLLVGAKPLKKPMTKQSAKWTTAFFHIWTFFLGLSKEPMFCLLKERREKLQDTGIDSDELERVVGGVRVMDLVMAVRVGMASY
ncbi:Cytochrome P450 71A1 [Linum perenne]